MSDQPDPATTEEKAKETAPSDNTAAVAADPKPAKDDKASGGNKGAAPAEEKKEEKGRRKGGRSFGRSPRKRENKEFEETIIGVDRVTRVTAGGRQMRFRVTVAIGDKKGRVGFGMGKSAEVMTGVQKAIAQAKRRLIKVPIYQDTIPHAVTAKFKASKVFLLPAPEGKGVIAGGTVRKMLELAGIKNVLSKIHGGRNKLTVAYATVKALEMLKNVAPPESNEKDAGSEEGSTEKAGGEEKAPKAKKEAPKKAAKKPAAQKETAKKKAAPKKAKS